MKRIPLLLCAAVLAVMPLTVMPVTSQAAVQAEGLRVGLGVGLLMGQQDDDRDHRRRREDPPPPAPQNRNETRNDDRRDQRDNRDQRDQRYNPPPPAAMYDRRPGGGGGNAGGGNGMSRAVAIGRGHGNVLNAWPQGGSLYLVRVDTPRGRVDMIIDVDTGRVVGER